MLKILGFDLGKSLGFGLLGGTQVLSGSHEILKHWHPLGAALLTLEGRLNGLIDQHKPDVIGTARPFVRYGGGRMIDTPQNLLPMFGAFAILNRLCALRELRLEVFQESDARSHMIGAGNMPRKSAEVKAAVVQAVRDRGWPACDDHAADALCIAAAVLELLDPNHAHQTSPLFVAASKSDQIGPKPGAFRQNPSKFDVKHRKAAS